MSLTPDEVRNELVVLQSEVEGRNDTCGVLEGKVVLQDARVDLVRKKALVQVGAKFKLEGQKTSAEERDAAATFEKVVVNGQETTVADEAEILANLESALAGAKASAKSVSSRIDALKAVSFYDSANIRKGL